MGPGILPDGCLQTFYYTDGRFKGVTNILKECGLGEAMKLKFQCKNFLCPEGSSTSCCQKRVLYNEPDFHDQLSAVEDLCHKNGFRAIFLPKFHCELNPIEQCWGHAKRVYRKYPLSSHEDVLEKNVLSALGTITLDHIWK
jgi:hypothetical protein